MKKLLGYFLVGLVGTLAGAAYSSFALAFPPLAVHSIDLGQVSLNQPVTLLIPFANAHPYRLLQVTDITTSCGCATVSTDSIEVQPQAIGVLPVLVRPAPPETKVEFAVSAIINGAARAQVTVSGRVMTPFDGYPKSIVARATGQGLIVPIDPTSGFNARAALHCNADGPPLECYWDAYASAFVCPLCAEWQDAQFVIWKQDQPEPV